LIHEVFFWLEALIIQPLPACCSHFRFLTPPQGNHKTFNGVFTSNKRNELIETNKNKYERDNRAAFELSALYSSDYQKPKQKQVTKSTIIQV